MPNLKAYESLLKEAIEGGEETKSKEGEMVIEALLDALMLLEEESIGLLNGFANGHTTEMKKELDDKIGPLLAGRVSDMQKPKLAKAILEC